MCSTGVRKTWKQSELIVNPDVIIFSMIENGERWRKTVSLDKVDIIYDALDSPKCKDCHLSESLKPMTSRKLHMCFKKENIDLESITHLISDIKRCYDILYPNQTWEISYDTAVMENDYWYQVLFHVIHCEDVFEMESLISDIYELSSTKPLLDLRISYEIDMSVDWALKGQYGMKLIQGHCSSSQDWFIGVYTT
tara:strand:- start:6396 stop:6980 length:585 start_codon:yes stop_codon:yes gene_type:complete